MSRGPDIRRSARAVAAEIVHRWLATGDFPDRLVDAVDADHAAVMEYVYGVTRWRRRLEWVVRRCARHRPERTVLAFLFLGLYQILQMDAVADYAAVNETVEALKTAHGEESAGFVNAVLRRVLRERETIREELAQQTTGVRESHPEILVKRWTRRFGAERTEALCRWNNLRPRVTVRPNRRRTDLAALLEALREQGITAQPHPFAPDEFAELAPAGRPIAALPGYREGLFTVQDAATVCAVRLLDPRPGECILDACAAPGGKAALIGERMGGEGRLVAMDLYEDRLARLRLNVERMGLTNVNVIRGNAAMDEMEEAVGGIRFDRILLDVPCTNTGVLRRRPDARWRFSRHRLRYLAKVQRSMLDSAVRFLKPGGRLVYSTCSLEPEEGDELVEAWYADHPEMEGTETVSLFPPDANTDGVFAAALNRKPAGTGEDTV